MGYSDAREEIFVTVLARVRSAIIYPPPPPPPPASSYLLADDDASVLLADVAATRLVAV